MKSQNLFLLSVLLVELMLLTIQKSQALFSDAAISSANTFIASNEFPQSVTLTTTATSTPTSTPSFTPTPTSPVVNHIVISEVQIIGDNASNDFVELYNPTDNSVDLSGWQIRIKSSTGTDASLVLIGNGISIPAYGFFLWANDEGGYSGTISADISNSNNLSANNSLLLEDASDTPIDKVGWGNSTSPYVEGTAITANPDNNQSIERKAYAISDTVSMTSGADALKGNGYDSDNNNNDFISRSVSQPQYSGSATEIP